MMPLRYWVLLAVAGTCRGSLESRKRLEKDNASGTWTIHDKNFSSSIINDLKFASIKWSEILETVGEGTMISERRLIQRKPWCKSQQLRVQVSSPGCTSRRIVTRFCYGQCSSFYIPRPGTQFDSCPSCRPSKGSWISPLLFCNGLPPVKSPPIYRVKKCKCLAVK